MSLLHPDDRRKIFLRECCRDHFKEMANLIKSLSINLKVFSHSSFAMLKLHSLYPYIDCQFEIIFFLLISMS